jgi:hypothetical protein
MGASLGSALLGMHFSFTCACPAHLQVPVGHQPERDAAPGVERHDQFDHLVSTPRHSVGQDLG